MPLDEREKKELAEKIVEQRRSMWKGEAKDKRQKKKRRERKKTKPVLDRQQDREGIQQTLVPPYQITKDRQEQEVEQPIEKQQKREKEELTEKIKEQRRSVWKGEPTDKRRTKKRERKKTKPVSDRQSNRSKEKKDKDARSSVPTLRLALLVVIGLIAAIMIGVAIGYLAAVRDLIKI
jgi:hypothetical protein